jgi:hypothetical protein
MVLPARFHDPTVFGSLADAQRLETGSQLCCHQTRSSIAVSPLVANDIMHVSCLVLRSLYLIDYAGLLDQILAPLSLLASIFRCLPLSPLRS